MESPKTSSLSGAKASPFGLNTNPRLRSLTGHGDTPSPETMRRACVESGKTNAALKAIGAELGVDFTDDTNS